VKATLALYRKLGGAKIILTGGWGDHFNTTSLPHAFYVARRLVRQGVPEEDILGAAYSRNTIEDAVYTRGLVRGLRVEKLYVVTSDYHLKRARAVFRELLPRLAVSFVAATANLGKGRLAQLRSHEQVALTRLTTRSWWRRAVREATMAWRSMGTVGWVRGGIAAIRARAPMGSA
jgi:uncharacterized SAM-binding protein YcdF (DUF218 family)